MSTYGRQVVDTGGRSVQVSADGRPRRKAGGVTLDWTLADLSEGGAGGTQIANDRFVPEGVLYIRYGTVLRRITASGKYGPVKTDAADGRETVAATVRGEAFILNRTVLETDPASDHPDVFDGGLVFRDRLVTGGTAPTEANIETMFPDITFVDD